MRGLSGRPRSSDSTTDSGHADACVPARRHCGFFHRRGGARRRRSCSRRGCRRASGSAGTRIRRAPLRRPAGRAGHRACERRAVLWRLGRRPCSASSRASPFRSRSFCGRSVHERELASGGRSARPPLSTRQHVDRGDDSPHGGRGADRAMERHLFVRGAVTTHRLRVWQDRTCSVVDIGAGSGQFALAAAPACTYERDH